MSPDLSAPTNEELLAAVAVAKQRGLVEPSEREVRAKYGLRQLDADRARVASFNERAAAAGYVIAGKGLLVHRWDCRSIQQVVDHAAEFVENQRGDVAAGSSYYGAHLPKIVDEVQAREAALRGTARRRTCKTCAPVL